MVRHRDRGWDRDSYRGRDRDRGRGRGRDSDRDRGRGRGCSAQQCVLSGLWVLVGHVVWPGS